MLRQLQADNRAKAKQIKDLEHIVQWYSSLVTRAQVGTAKTPCLKSYIEQLEAELAQHKSAVDEAR